MKAQSGFGLIEVMIAFIVVAVTAGSLLQLNKTYLEYSRDGRNREIALRLAESKLDEFRGVQNRAEYSSISDASSTTKVNGTDYTVSWTVNDYGWDGSAWVTPLSTGMSSDKKEVVVSVDWDDAGNTPGIAISSVLSPYFSVSSGPFGSDEGGGQVLDTPEVTHIEGSAPIVIPIELGDGLTQESNRALPTVTGQGNSDKTVRVSFDTDTYDGTGKRAMQRQDLATISCYCNLVANGDASLPAKRMILKGLSYWDRGEKVSKKKGEAASNQDPLCDSCCANHFDGPENEFSHWYDAFKRPHGHYSSLGLPVIVTGSSYVEACRMVRVKGKYTVASDWNLVVMNIFDASFLSGSTLQQAYQDYVEEVVTEYIRIQVKAGSNMDVAAESNYSPRQFSQYLADNNIEPKSTNVDKIQPGLRQLVARGIYVDIVSPEYRQQLLDGVMGGNADATPDNLLRYVPFYEVNLTLFAEWSSSKEEVAPVSNEEVQTIVDTSEKYYGVYSRGVVNGLVEGNADITATIRRSNSGITAFQALSPNDTDTRSSTLNVKVVAADPGSISVTGAIKCITYDNKKVEIVCDEAQKMNIKVLYKGEICSQTSKSTGKGAKNNQGISYSCSVSKSGDPILMADLPDTGYEAVSPDGDNDWQVPLPKGSIKESIPGGCLLVVVDKPEGVTLPGTCN
ncbi:type II secretory pathway pseudopilin PulG [Oceanisphaera litoralis]|uniref:type IV pilus modification PilV family protein n=1 Tax=Oceanisphaera litoralis TaxID=225144 RepID=UPI001959E13A|nr:prepilin-type N-terminal cleavage/methylation domain-containing protein [Oceanisphaera litoralis]MBM7456928.1 type II secretory pathway pseudopilin PulG [Oceanisphaera litoralis]